jgi:hypothetical protein
MINQHERQEDESMATYNLYIVNNSGVTKSYVFFMQPPLVSAKGGQPKVFANAWVTFNSVTNGGFDHIQYTDLTSAYWGTARTPIAVGTLINQGGTALVDVTQQDSVTFYGSSPPLGNVRLTSSPGGIGFSPVTHGGAITGAYRIIANQDFTMANGYVFGLARPGNLPGLPTPVASFDAEPNETYNITPVVKFYVSDGAYTSGEVIDYSSMSTTAGTIDFTGLPQTTAVVNQDSHGAFSVSFS